MHRIFDGGTGLVSSFRERWPLGSAVFWSEAPLQSTFDEDVQVPHQCMTSHSRFACDEDGRVHRHLSWYHLTVDAGVCAPPPPLVRVSMGVPATITFCSRVAFDEDMPAMASYRSYVAFDEGVPATLST